MEKIKVNMSPNPLDVQTIHASQNDGEARQWEFELHNNGELIDTSNVTEQLFFKAYKGGTEQLLPENTSTPTTSPFLGDIKYPQGLLTDQEFTYRQSPTEEDGLAKITDIKGNTLNWNQLASTLPQTQETEYGLTFTNNNDGSITINGTSTNTTVRHPAIISGNSSIEWLTTHIYLINFANSTMTLAIRPASAYTFESGALTNGIGIFKPNSDLVGGLCIRINANSSMVFDNYRAYPQVFDLTKMFGSTLANAIYAMEQSQVGSGVAYFRSLFPLPYYGYNQGSLLSFNGNGIKTVGFNQWDEEWEVGNINPTTGSNASSTDRIRSKNYVPLVKGESYFFKGNANLRFYDGNKTFIGTGQVSNSLLSIPDNASYLRFICFPTYGLVYKNDICVNISKTGENGKYEPYTSSTLSLPISNYFPTGMKRAGNVYDELTESKAITRIGRVDLGSLEWSYNSTYGMYSIGISNSVKKPSASSVRANAISSVGTFTDWATFYASGTSSGLWAINTSGYIGIATTETNSTTFKNSLQGVYLYYELATPTETSFTTASLVTENAEIPLSNNDGVLIGKCTEQLSAEPGFHDAKIKLSDSDGTCYSNKLQLHVERSPQ